MKRSKVRKFKTIVFDMDGTLIDSSEGVTKCVNHALKHFNKEVEDITKLNCCIGPPLIYSFTTFFGMTEEEAKEGIRLYRERYEPVGVFECKLFDGVENCLKELHRRGYRITLGSSKPEEMCKKILDHFNLTGYFDEVAGATKDGRIDTKEEVLRELIRREGGNVSDMVLIGDTIYDVEGAASVGMDTIAVSFGFGKMDEMKKAGILASCDSFDELPEIIKGLES